MSNVLTKRSALNLMGMAAIACALVGCSSGGGAEEATENSPARSASQGAQTNASPEGGGVAEQPGADADLRETRFPIAADDAVRIANDAVSGGFVYGIELDHDDTDAAWEWEINLLDGDTEHEVEIDAVTGEIISQKQESTNDAEQPVDLADPMTYDDALDLATAEVEGPLRGWKLEWDDGRREYQFDLMRGDREIEVTVDVDTRAVTLD